MLSYIIILVVGVTLDALLSPLLWVLLGHCLVALLALTIIIIVAFLYLTCYKPCIALSLQVLAVYCVWLASCSCARCDAQLCTVYNGSGPHKQSSLGVG